MYLGSEGYGVRPFLRIGTSPFLPEQIKRHIGSVVITDHLTGDFNIEADCLDPRSIKHTRYVGSADLVQAIKHFAHREQIPYQALEPVDGKHPPKGGQVVFFDDGNIRLYLDGHRLFDLTERERTDRHSVFRMTRIDAITKASRGAYQADDFSGVGFIAGRNGSILTYTGKRLFIDRHNEQESIARWSYWAVPLSLIFGVDNQVPASVLVDLYRFRLVNGLEVSGAADSGDVIDVFRAAGISEDDTSPPQLPPGAPCPTVDASARIVLDLPEGAIWSGDTPPPILPGVPYRYDTHVAHQEIRNLLTGDLRETIDGAVDPEHELFAIARRDDLPEIDRVVASLEVWNRCSNTNDTQRVAEARNLLETTFAVQHVPVMGVFGNDGERWHVRFVLPRDLTRGAIADNSRAREKIEPFLEATADPVFLESERKRLLSFLQEMLVARRVEAAPEASDKMTKAATATPPAAPAPSKGRDATASTAKSGPTSPRTTAPPPAKPAARSRGGNSRRPLTAVAAVLLLLLLGGALVYRFTGFSGAAAIAGNDITTNGHSTEETVDSATVADVPETQAPVDERADDQVSPDVPATGPELEPGPGLDPTAAPGVEGTSGDPGPAEVAPDGESSPDAIVPDPEGAPDAIITDPDEAPDAPDAVTPDPDPAGTPDATPATSAVGNDDPGQGVGVSPWTVADVLRVTNWIAQENGYNRIGVNDLTDGRNPNWIYPGNTFRLPDGVVHEVASGETLWFIASSFLNEIFVASEMELSRFRDLIDSEEYPVEELERRHIN